MTADVELSDEMFIITKETAEAYLKGARHSACTCRRTSPAAATPTRRRHSRAAGLIPADDHPAATRHAGTSGLNVDWRNSGAEMDELLHESSFQVRLGARLEANRES